MSSIKLTSDTLAVSPAGGELEYNGQFYGTDSNNSRAQLGRLVLETAKTATGTSVDFTGIPSWVKRITVLFNDLSTTGTAYIRIRFSTSGTFATSGYVGSASSVSGLNACADGQFTAGFDLVADNNTAATVRNGGITFNLLGANTWICHGVVASTDRCNDIAGKVTLAGVLDGVRITTVNGTDTFDAGTINILYEG